MDKLAQEETDDLYWLDNDGNNVNEQHVLDKLREGTDFMATVQALDAREREVVERLHSLGSGVAPAGKKRKGFGDPSSGMLRHMDETGLQSNLR